MSDITKCSGKKCKMRNECLRYTSKNSHWQSWSNFYIHIKNKKCDYFLSDPKKIIN